MRISVVIPTHNRAELLRRTLPTVLEQDFPASEYEIIVVDDGSSDGTREVLSDFEVNHRVRTVTQPWRGTAAARNAGVQIARGELILFLDDDCFCSPDLLAQHSAAHSTANPLVIGPTFVHGDTPAGIPKELMHAVSQAEAARIAASGPDVNDAMLCANSSVSRHLLLEHGGFDECFPRSEDIELGFRLWKAGISIVFRPAAVAQQLFVKSAEVLVHVDANLDGISEWRLVTKHPEYKPYSRLARLSSGPWWKKLARRIAILSPVSLDALLHFAYTLSSSRVVSRQLLRARMTLAFWRAAVREAGSWRNMRESLAREMPVLLYHRIGTAIAGAYPALTISSERFERHMRWLKRSGYETITISDWLAWRRGDKNLPRKPILLTFDDAYADLEKRCFPTLRKYGFRALVFVVTRQIGQDNAWDVAQGYTRMPLLSAHQIRAWAKQGIEFGAHTRSHRSLQELDPDSTLAEIAGSKADLETILGERVNAFAYPYGEVTESAATCVEAHFPAGFTTAPGRNVLLTRANCLKRIEVQPSDSAWDLWLRIHLGRHPVERLRGLVKRAKLWLKRRTPAPAVAPAVKSDAA